MAPPEIQAVCSSLITKLLRVMPPFKGKGRVARRLLSKSVRNRCTLIHDRYGNEMAVPNLIEPVGFWLGVNGSYEPEEIDFAREHLSRDTDLIDVGANIGSLTVALARHARRVIAIEASPAVVPFLRRNVQMGRHTNVDVVECAVSAPGIDSVPFYVPPMDRFGTGTSSAQGDVEPVSVAARTLDAIVRDYGSERTGVVKIDVEGFEAHVFLGAMELLNASDSPIIMFEFADWAEESAFPGRKGWAQQILLDAGYSLWALPEYVRKKAPLAQPITDGFYTIIGRKL